MELDVANYMNPQWWSAPWGWMAFMPHEPDYKTPPFSELMKTPRCPRRIPESGWYEMPSYLRDSWSKLELNLTMATHLLQDYYNVAVIRPLYPLGFGYKKAHSREGAAMRSIHKSKEWFTIWLGLFSYLIATAEAKENELHDYEHLSKKGWADFLVEKGAERTWVESVINSGVFRFDADIRELGVQ